MTTPTSGQSISFSQLRDEFGANNGTAVSLGAYRVSQSVGTLTNVPLDTGVPQSGTIKTSDLQGKQLNVVVDAYSGTATTRLDASAVYAAKQITVIGGFKTTAQVPSLGTGSRVIVNVNKQIGSAKGNRNYAALKTGSWGTGTTLEVVIGPSGGIYGGGGDGGGSGSGGSGGSSGADGSSALGIQYPTKITNQGVIVRGRGGGGGGGGGIGGKCANVQGCQGCSNTNVSASGGGGGGGAGFPAGNGVQGAGQGTISTNGTGAAGSTTETNCGRPACNGGRGGDGGSNGSNGGTAFTTSGGSAGNDGYAILTDPSASYTLTGNAVTGSTATGTVL
jgi:hypothetical protein